MTMVQQRRGYANRGGYAPRRGNPNRRGYANRPVWYAVIVISIVVVVGFALAGYEINHLRTEVNGMHAQIQSLNNQFTALFQVVLKLVPH
jgi:hypothetical protein